MCLGELAQVVDLVDDRTVRARVGDRLVTLSLLTLDGPVAPGWPETLDHQAIHNPRRPGASDRPHNFPMITDLPLLGYFTSEIGYPQAQR